MSGERGGLSLSLQHHFGLTNSPGVSDITPNSAVRETFASENCRRCIKFMGRSTLFWFSIRLNKQNLKQPYLKQQPFKLPNCKQCIEIDTNHPSLFPTGTKKRKKKRKSTFLDDPPKWAGIKSLSPPSHKASSHLLTTSPHRCAMFSLCQQFCPPSPTFWSRI